MRHAVSAKFTAIDGTPLGELVLHQCENQTESFRMASAYIDSGCYRAETIRDIIDPAATITYCMKGV